MLLIKWYGIYHIKDGNVDDHMEFPEDRIKDILLKITEGDLSPVKNFISQYPDEELRIAGELKNRERLREILLEITAKKMELALGEDYILVQTLAAYDDIITMLNLMSERIIELEKIESIKKSKVEEAEILREEYENMKNLRDALGKKIEAHAKKLAPNLSAVIGETLAARLISYAGGLKRLSRMPASTIQILGAEDAFFQHLRKGTPCPKHGIIFQSPLIRNMPPQCRGRAARAIAGKLAIAARVDYYGGDFVGDSLGEELKARLEEIKNDTCRSRK